MKFFTTVVFIFASLVLFSQDTKSITGKWKFVEVPDNKKYDTTQVKRTEEFFKNMTLQLDIDGAYLMIVWGIKEIGNWTIKEDRIRFDTKGNISYFRIVKKEPDVLILERRGIPIILIKMKDAIVEKIVIESKLKKVDFHEVTKQQINGKWVLERVEYTNDQPEEMNDAASFLFERNFMQFKSNGRYNGKIYNLKEKGIWKLGNGNTTIISLLGDKERVWKVVSATKTSLILAINVNKAKWIFKAK